MSEPTDEMIADAMQAHNATGAYGPVVAAVLAIVERDYHVIRKTSPEELAAAPKAKRRLRECVERWPGAEIDGDYDPRCCRWPKSCSATVYDPERVSDEDLEPER